MEETPGQAHNDALYDTFIQNIVAEAMHITSVTHTDTEAVGTLRFSGQLRMEPRQAYAYLDSRFQTLGFTPLLREEKEGVELLIVPGRISASQSRLWLALLLFFLTVASTIFVGSLVIGNGLIEGIAFSLALLSILLTHELGHFLVARKLGVAVSFPFFIPMPFTIIGTMGAFIAMKEPPPDRRALFSIAIAGPLAGLVVAVPVLILGLMLSETGTMEPPFFLEGNSLLYALVKWGIFGQFLPNGNLDVQLHPVAFAGWVGLLVTALNLIPAGQLDGGHILYGLVGPQTAHKVTWGIIALLLVLGFVWYGWFLWAALIFLFGRRRAPLLNELVPLDRGQQVVAVLLLIIFVLIFTPVPFTVVQ